MKQKFSLLFIHTIGYNPPSPSIMSHLGGHIDALRTRFGNVEIVCQRPGETLLQVEREELTHGCTLTLYVALSETFPNSPPTVAYAGGRKVSIAPEDPAGVAAMSQAVWVPGKSQLVDAVGNAFNNIANLWGDVAPPSLKEVEGALASKSDSVLEDIASNPNCLESYSHQLSFLKKVRDARLRAADDVEKALEENRRLQKEVMRVRGEVEELQQRLEAQLATVQDARRRIPLLDAIGSPEALAKTLAADVKTLDTQCEKIAKDLLAVDYSSDKRDFDTLIEEYKQKAKERHIMDLKRRAYHASLA